MVLTGRVPSAPTKPEGVSIQEGTFHFWPCTWRDLENEQFCFWDTQNKSIDHLLLPFYLSFFGDWVWLATLSFLQMGSHPDYKLLKYLDKGAGGECSIYVNKEDILHRKVVIKKLLKKCSRNQLGKLQVN